MSQVLIKVSKKTREKFIERDLDFQGMTFQETELLLEDVNLCV